MLYLKESTIPGAGKGLYTDAPIKKGETIIEYKGDILTWNECNKRNEEGKGGYVFYVTRNYCIDAFDTLEAMARYANDAKGHNRIKGLHNNSEYVIRNKKKAFVVATKNIKADSEILVSYGTDYWSQIEKRADANYSNHPVEVKKTKIKSKKTKAKKA